MSTTGQFSSKNPTIKRILKEASELANQPSVDYHAAPLETDLFEWHFTIRGAPAPSPFEGGLYHGRIVLPPAYPLKPPSFRFLTPAGRFEVNREICLSISGHHEETWQPAWGIRTALVAIRSFMDTSASGQLGGMEAAPEVRKRMAGQSVGFKRQACGKTNAEIMKEQEDAVGEMGEDGNGKKEVVPEELRLAYREDLSGKEKQKAGADSGEAKTATPASAQQPALQSNAGAANAPVPSLPSASRTTTIPAELPAAPAQPPAQPAQAQARRPAADDGLPSWIDKAIYGIVAALVILIWRKLGSS